MDVLQIAVGVAQLTGTVGGLVWIARRNTGQIDKVIESLNAVKIDTAVIKETIAMQADIRKDVKADHDQLIIVKEVVKQHSKDIAGQHGKIREHRAELETMIYDRAAVQS